jgi:hypothetical protein
MGKGRCGEQLEGQIFADTLDSVVFGTSPPVLSER